MMLIEERDSPFHTIIIVVVVVVIVLALYGSTTRRKYKGTSSMECRERRSYARGVRPTQDT